MLERKKIGILFNFRSVWMGGIIYVINIVKTFDFLDDEEKPELYLFYNPDLKKFLNEFNYPYIKFVEWDFPTKVKGIIQSKLKSKNLFIDDILKSYSLDALYPMHDFPVRTKTDTNLVAWWADLQEKHYPEFFTRKEKLSRQLRAKLILKNCDSLVLSSNDVYKDFKSFYKLRDKMKVSIFHFVSIVDNINEVLTDNISNSYNLPEEYYIVSNQFHKHKNHKVLLQSMALLKERGIKVHMAMTGKMPSDSQSMYLKELQSIISDNKLEDQITMLGLIPRADQLKLMRYAKAVIQPSLFEGWSTVIEDARSLQVPVIASNLDVNIEQLGKNANIFAPHNPEQLANILKDFPKRDLSKSYYEDYNVRVNNAAKTLMEILTEN